MNAAQTKNVEAEWASRALCPDESCIGVLGADGKCRVCGQRGELPNASATAAAEHGPDDAPDASSDDGLEDEARAAAQADDDEPADESGDALAERELCLDESCIGVLDENGACKVCGAKKS